MTQAIADTIRTLLAQRSGRTLDPTEVARALAGADERKWRLMMTPIRREAVRLAKAGEIELRRKGRPIPPDELRGIYRIAAVATGGTAAGAGNSASVLPVAR